MTFFRQFFSGLLFTLALALALSSPLVTHAEECDEIQCSEDDDEAEYIACLNDKRDCYQDRLDDARGKKSTLTSTINAIQSKINLQQLQIRQTQAEITALEKEVDELTERIGGLNLSLDRLTSMLVERVRAQYKEMRTSPFSVLASTDSFNNVVIREEYVNVAGQQTALAMQRAEMQRLVYDQQKELKEKKQAEVEGKKTQLESEKQVLAAQQQEQKTLLEITKNDEVKFQQLLNEAQAQINSFKSFVSTADSAGTVGPDGLGKGYDGTYFSQRDSRWANSRIGNSNEIVYEVGCLLTSVAMALKARGVDTNPGSIASNSSFFFADTAYMLLRSQISLPGGKSSINVSVSSIDDHLDKKNPVIVGVKAGPYGTHFVVLKKNDGDDWIMYDPWYGPDIKFSDHYSTGSIYKAETIL